MRCGRRRTHFARFYVSAAGVLRRISVLQYRRQTFPLTAFRLQKTNGGFQMRIVSFS